MANAKKDSNSVAVATGVSDLDGVTILPWKINHTTGRVMTSAVIATSGFSPLTATGTVDGSNTSFTFASAPSVIIVDGKIFRKTSSDGTVNWTGTTSVTLTIAPVSDIFGA